MTKIRFENSPSTKTPINADNLNKLNNVVISPTEPTTGEEVWIQKGKNLFNPENVCVGYINNDTGVLNTNSINSLSTNFIKVSGSKNYYLGYSKQGGSWGAWYDKDRNYISGIAIGSYTGGVLQAPENAEYLRFTVSYDGNNTDYASNTFIVQSDVETSYEPYIDKKIYTKNDNGVYEEFYNEDKPINITTGVEYETGRIIDGKKEYGLRKNLGALPNSDAIDYTIGISNNYNITNYRLYAVQDNRRLSIPYFNVSDPSYYLLGYVRGNVAPIRCNYDLSAYSLVVDMKYTKD